MKHVITIIECALVITVIGALLPSCASIDSFNRAHPEVLSAADQLCHVVHAAHEAEAVQAVQGAGAADAGPTSGAAAQPSIAQLPPPEPGAQ